MQAFKERKKSNYYMECTKKLLHSFYSRLKIVRQISERKKILAKKVPPSLPLPGYLMGF
jgi:hypothetical protein